MVSKTIRKIMKDGGSKTIALPPHWLQAVGADVGDRLEIIYDSVILIKPVGERIEFDLLQKELMILEKRLGIKR